LQANASTARLAIINQGIGGNALVAGGLGPTATERFDRDVLGPSRVRWLIVLEGVNDLGASTSRAIDRVLVATYRRFIQSVHARGIRAYGAPILPFGGSQYDSAEHEAARQAVNVWIRASGEFDAVVDLDRAVRDPADPARLAPAFDSGDHLHLNPAGYRAMADAVDLSLFAPGLLAKGVAQVR
jgi:lysophospholipase L1-like esterase